METKDLIVIGGGINGAGIAADAAGRGLSVLMLEAQDLACATSSASSKLIHVACATWNTTNFVWSAKRWLNVKSC